jgi:hypothetical protein
MDCGVICIEKKTINFELVEVKLKKVKQIRITP